MFYKNKKMKTILLSILFFLITISCFSQKQEPKMIATIFDKFDGSVSKEDLLNNGIIEI